MTDSSELEDVGYGKPPLATRFRKGISGNPSGRPKGSKNLSALLLQEGRKRVQVNGPKGPKTIMKNQAVAMQLANLAAKGNLPAIRAYAALLTASEQAALANAPAVKTAGEIDVVTMRSLAKRLRRNQEPNPNQSAKEPQ